MKKPEEQKNWDKLDKYGREGVRSAHACGFTVTINDDGLYIIDLKLFPSTPNAHLKK